MTATEGDLLHTVETGDLPEWRRRAGRWIVRGATGLLAAVVAVQMMQRQGVLDWGITTWRPTLYAYLVWAVAIGAGQVLSRGEQGKRALFLLPAVFFTVAMVIFPMIFGVSIALSDWNLASLDGRKFNGLANFWQMLGDSYYWNAMKNMGYYVAAVAVEYAIAFGLALLLNAQIRAQKFFRVVFLLPLMLSPVAVSWMIGKSMMEIRFGPLANFARWLGWETPSFFGDPMIARASIMLMDAWTFIPFMMILMLAGLQALPKEVMEAAKVDGAGAWQTFWKITFPLLMPVSITAIVLRIIFKLKLADIVINVTSGATGSTQRHAAALSGHTFDVFL